MRLPLRIAAMSSVAATAAVIGIGINAANAAGDAGTSSLPACVQVTTEARYVPYGYNHIVSVKNGCSKIATCSVSTDVNPKPIPVEVAPGVTSEVVTFVASPSQTFTAHVTCTLR